MKHLLLFLIFISAATVIQAQPWNGKTSDRNMIFTRTEVEAAFEGGEKAWNEYLAKNLTHKISKKARAGEYTVLVQFIVHKDGSLTDVIALTDHGYGMEKEAIRLIKNTPKWIPAKQNGHDVTAYHKQGILFNVE